MLRAAPQHLKLHLLLSKPFAAPLLQLLRLLQQGVADAATPILSYLAADDPMSEAIDLAGIAPDLASARAVSEAWAPVLDAHFAERNDARVLGVLAYPSGAVG